MFCVCVLFKGLFLNYTGVFLSDFIVGVVCVLSQGVFAEVVGGKRKKPSVGEENAEQPKGKKNRESGKDEEFYIPYRPKDFNSERGYADITFFTFYFT